MKEVIAGIMMHSCNRRTTDFLTVFPLSGAGLLIPKIVLQGRSGRTKCPGETKAFKLRNHKKAFGLVAPAVFQEAWNWLSLMMISLLGFRVGIILGTWTRHSWG
jgi:hypothetical protein